MPTILMLGTDHRLAPLDLRERIGFAPGTLSGDLPGLLARPAILEGAILSTCNRTEIYAAASDADAGLAALRGFLAERRGLESHHFERHFVSYVQTDAVSHLFRVAAGLESQILGEGQVLGQVKAALASAKECRTAGSVIDPLFRFALSAGKRARNETGIGRGAVSLAAAALEFARRELGTLEGRRILVIGTGKMAGAAVRYLAKAGLAEILVANRTLDGAVRLAESAGGTAIPFIQMGAAIARVDLVLCCVAAPHHVLTASDLEAVLAGRAHRPLLLLDLGLPRNIAPDVERLPGVRLCDLEGLEDIAGRNRVERSEMIPAVERIVSEEVEAFLSWLGRHRRGPEIASFRQDLDAIRDAELANFWKRHGAAFSERQRELVADLSRRLLNKAFHGRLAGMEEGGKAHRPGNAESLESRPGLGRGRRPLTYANWPPQVSER